MGDMYQVEELLDIIAAHKEMGVTGASVMFSFFKRRVQPIQQRYILGFEYKGVEDPSRMCVEELSDEAALTGSDGCYWMWTLSPTSRSCLRHKILRNR
jgi:hypothetical protein